MNAMNTLKMLGLAGALTLGISTSAFAIPSLQLTILDGVYNTTTDTTVAKTNSFTLYALLQPNQFNLIGDDYFLSIALSPKTGPASGNFGSFEISSSTVGFTIETTNPTATTVNKDANENVSVTGDMVYGTPPLDTFLAQNGTTGDPGDLPDHNIYETFYAQIKFKFDSNVSTTPFNVEPSGSNGENENPDTNTTGAGAPTSALADNNGELYFVAFNINVKGLTGGKFLHFDLYNTNLCTDGRGQCGGNGDIDINKFAPFSHDAQSCTGEGCDGTTPPTEVPEPAPLALLGIGLLGLAGTTMRRRRVARTA